MMMGLVKPYVKRIASAGEIVPVTDHNKQENQLEALTVFGNRVWTTGTRPTPSADDLYPRGFNTSLDIHEIWNGVAWVPIASAPSLDWEYIGITRLGSRQATITLAGLSCGLASADAKYRSVFIRGFIRAGSGAVLNPLMYANGDTTGTNYYGVAGTNDAKIYSGNLGLGGFGVRTEGCVIRANSLVAYEHQYEFGIMETLKATTGAVYQGAVRGWCWLNPATSDDVLDNLQYVAPANDFEIGCFLEAWGIRPGI